MTSAQEYIAVLLTAIVVGVSCYNIGYDLALKDHVQPTKYRCHEEVVYRWTGSYWDKMGQACKTDKQLQGTT